MAANKITLNNLDGCKITVRLSIEFKVRMFLTTRLLKLAAWVSGAEIEIVD